MTGEKQEERSSVALGAMQCPTPRPSTNTRCKKRKLETQEVVLPEENEPEEGCQDHVTNVWPFNVPYSTVYYILLLLHSPSLKILFLQANDFKFLLLDLKINFCLY